MKYFSNVLDSLRVFCLASLKNLLNPYCLILRLIVLTGTARIEDISLIANFSSSKLRSIDLGINKMGAPQVPSSFWGASSPNLVHSTRHNITARTYA